MLDLFFLQSLPTSAKDRLPFKQPEIFTLSLKFSTFTLTLLWRLHLLFERQIFTKLRAGKQQITEGVFKHN
jgi:hypothetical protein